MARLKQALSEDEVKKLGVANVRKAYNTLANDYNRIINNDVLLCPKCNSWLKADTSFYYHEKYATNRYPICKSCLQLMVEQRNSDRESANETKQSVQSVLMMMDRIYDDNFYEQCIKGAKEELKEKNRISPFSTYITSIQSLPNWKDSKTGKVKPFSESIFEIDSENITTEINENSRIVKSGRKRFGKNYSTDDLYWLESEYQDWIARYPCDSKSQEVLFKTLVEQEFARDELRRNGANTKDIDKSIQDTMTALNIKPSQSDANALADTLTFSQLISKWEESEPIPECDEELKDVDKIGSYIDIFYKGHLAKMMGLSNGYSQSYDEFMSKYTVDKPEINEEEEEILFNTIFGASKLEDGG